MPHYADGNEAKVGDYVVGQLYNTPGTVAGTIVSITPGADSCNAKVQYTRVVPPEALGTEKFMAVEYLNSPPGIPAHVVKPTANHQSDGPLMALVTCADYCEVRKLTKVG